MGRNSSPPELLAQEGRACPWKNLFHHWKTRQEKKSENMKLLGWVSCYDCRGSEEVGEQEVGEQEVG